MSNVKEWSESVLKRALGTFINTFLGALVGVGIADAAALVELGSAGYSVTDGQQYVAALSAGLVAAITRQLIPAAQKVGTKLSNTAEKDLEI